MCQHTPTDSDALLSLLQQVKRHYQEPPPAPTKRGKRRDFSALSFLLLAVVAVVTRTSRYSELRELLPRDTALRGSLGFPSLPHRATVRRRIARLHPAAGARGRAVGL